MTGIRTDLAYEQYTQHPTSSIFREEKLHKGCRLHILETKETTGGIPKGRHLTLFSPPSDEDPFAAGDHLCDALFSLLRTEAERLLGTNDFTGKHVLFVGLGNAAATVDSFGPSAARRIRPTAHIKEEAPTLFSLLPCAALAVFCPGVSGSSGIKSTALLSAVLSSYRPDLLLVGDSLVAADPSHLGRTLQLSDAGLRPGGGMHRREEAIDQAFAGCPVLSVGLPTAVHVSSLFRDLDIEPPPKVCGNEHYLAPSSVDLLIAEAADALGKAVERAFGIPH